MDKNALYSASNIQLPANRSPIQFRRENGAMYYGGNDGEAIQRLLVEYIDFLLKNQHTQRVQITILPEASFIVQDFGSTIASVDGCGLPEDQVFHLLGAAQKCSVDLHSAGQHYQLSYNGELTVPTLQLVGSSQAAYHRIYFEPDRTIFNNRSISIHQLLGSLRGLAMLFRGCRIEIVDVMQATTNQLFYPNGLRDYLDELIYHDLNPQRYLAFEGANEHVQIKLGLRFGYFSRIEQCLLRYKHVPFEPSYRRGMLKGLAAGLTTYAQAHGQITASQIIEPAQIRDFGCLLVLDQLPKTLQDAGGRPSDQLLIEPTIQQIIQQQLPEKLVELTDAEIHALVMW
ncbi:MAG: hypothetical protein LCH85_24515 [Chloroflexi bacterium]|nr:hypothetical protein [Chloroflexota bacterium]